jgi:hypothetical protein
MKSCVIHSLIILTFTSFSLQAQQSQDTVHLANLRKSGLYDAKQGKNFPDFTYQFSSEPNLVKLRRKYNLDSVAGKGTDVQKAIRLLEWFHNQVPHEDTLNIRPLNAENIITHYRTTGRGQGCYPLAIGMNEVLLSMGFQSRVVICFSNKYPRPDGGHVINAVYIPSLTKWIYMDPQDNAYIKDELNNFLSIEEVRQRLIDNKPLIINETANYHQVPTNAAEYLYQFMAEHLYRVICPLNSQYNGQTQEKGKTIYYVELLPTGSVDPAIDMFETGFYSNSKVITVHTNNNVLFWERPRQTELQN